MPGRTRSSGGGAGARTTNAIRATGERRLVGLFTSAAYHASVRDVPLLRGRVDEIGHLLGQAWQEKQRMSSRITTPLISEAVERALARGALGGKVTGAGGGGHMIFICEFEKRHLVAEELIRLGLSVTEFTFTQHGVTTWRGQA